MDRSKLCVVFVLGYFGQVHSCTTSGWSHWINEHKPSHNLLPGEIKHKELGADDYGGDYETSRSLPANFCSLGHGTLTKIECVDALSGQNYSTAQGFKGNGITCDVVKGFTCHNRMTNNHYCKDYKIRLYCNCANPSRPSTTKQAPSPNPTRRSTVKPASSANPPSGTTAKMMPSSNPPAPSTAKQTPRGRVTTPAANRGPGGGGSGLRHDGSGNGGSGNGGSGNSGSGNSGSSGSGTSGLNSGSDKGNGTGSNQTQKTKQSSNIGIPDNAACGIGSVSTYAILFCVALVHALRMR